MLRLIFSRFSVFQFSKFRLPGVVVASVAKAQHLGRDLDTLRVNYA